jgi:hypothetical protein
MTLATPTTHSPPDLPDCIGPAQHEIPFEWNSHAAALLLSLDAIDAIDAIPKRNFHVALAILCLRVPPLA